MAIQVKCISTTAKQLLIQGQRIQMELLLGEAQVRVWGLELLALGFGVLEALCRLHLPPSLPLHAFFSRVPLLLSPFDSVLRSLVSLSHPQVYLVRLSSPFLRLSSEFVPLIVPEESPIAFESSFAFPILRLS